MAEYMSENSATTRTRPRGQHRAANQPNRLIFFLRRLMAVGLNQIDD